MSSDATRTQPTTAKIAPWLSVADATKAVGAGATEIATLTEENVCRIGRVVDPSGHHWEVGKPLTP